MKILITVQAASLDALVDMRFGRTACFCLVDNETGTADFFTNEQNLTSSQGAGIQAALFVVESGADVVLTGHCGPKAFAILKKSNIKVYTDVSGTAKDAVDEFNKGIYKEARASDVEGHWV